ncbi:MAG TPA: hypothetical protein VHB19_01790 [Devosia sp.]|jgi:hypothetical protein|nr:hypothetical protein [Devosia sp.]
MRILIAAATALPLMLSSITLTALPTPVLAMSNNPSCTVTTYYNNADHDKVVGTRTVCTGQPTKKTGRSSPYYEVDHFSTGTGGSGHPHGNPGNLPCEFLQAGCSNLPTNRFN